MKCKLKIIKLNQTKQESSIKIVYDFLLSLSLKKYDYDVGLYKKYLKN